MILRGGPGERSRLNPGWRTSRRSKGTGAPCHAVRRHVPLVTSVFWGQTGVRGQRAVRTAGRRRLRRRRSRSVDPPGVPPAGRRPALDSSLGLTQQTLETPGIDSRKKASRCAKIGPGGSHWIAPATQAPTRDSGGCASRGTNQHASGSRSRHAPDEIAQQGTARSLLLLSIGLLMPRRHVNAGPRQTAGDFAASLRQFARESREALEKQETPGTDIPRASTAPNQDATDRRAARAQCATPKP